MQGIEQDKLAGAICAATKEVFETMLNIELASEPAYMEPKISETSDGVVAFLGLAGQWIGSGILHCDVAMAGKLYTGLLMAEPPAEGEYSITADVLDAVAEVANMIIGNVKNNLEEQLGPLGMSIPTVVFGRNFRTHSAANDAWIVVPFVSGGSRMDVRLCLAPCREPQAVKHGFAVPRMFVL
jgi:chemotaxis protein CheX